MSDGTATSTATLIITVTGINDAPVGVNDTGYIKEGGTLMLQIVRLLVLEQAPVIILEILLIMIPMQMQAQLQLLLVSPQRQQVEMHKQLFQVTLKRLQVSTVL